MLEIIALILALIAALLFALSGLLLLLKLLRLFADFPFEPGARGPEGKMRSQGRLLGDFPYRLPPYAPGENVRIRFFNGHNAPHTVRVEGAPDVAAPPCPLATLGVPPLGFDAAATPNLNDHVEKVVFTLDPGMAGAPSITITRKTQGEGFSEMVAYVDPKGTFRAAICEGPTGQNPPWSQVQP